MSFVPKRSFVLLSVLALLPAAYAIDKGKEKFTPPPLESFPGKQTNQGVIVAAMPYTTDEQTKTAFGKLNPTRYGVLPVLLVIKNDSKDAIRLSNMKLEYIDSRRSRVEATPASEVQYARGPQRPSFNPSPIPGIKRSRKNPLAAEEIEVRAFAAKMLPPGETAFGFVYFQTHQSGGDRLYVTGLEEAATGKELLFFDVPMN